MESRASQEDLEDARREQQNEKHLSRARQCAPTVCSARARWLAGADRRCIASSCIIELAPLESVGDFSPEGKANRNILSAIADASFGKPDDNLDS